MNQALRDYLEARREPLEDTVHRVIREALAAYASGEDTDEPEGSGPPPG